MKTAQQLEAEFRKDLSELLAKYDAQMIVHEKDLGYSTYSDGIEVYAFAKYDNDGNQIVPAMEFLLSTSLRKDSL